MSQETSDPSGLTAKELFQRGFGIKYTDFTTINTTFSDITREDVDLTTNLGKDVVLSLPIIASPMHTVTNAQVCIALALQGGIGALHYKHTDESGKATIEPQIKEIIDVKRFQNGFIESPVTVSPDMTIQKAIDLGKKYSVGDSFLTTFPVTDSGKSDGKLIGLLRKQDYWSSHHTDLPVRDRMLSLDKLIVAPVSFSLDEAREKMWDHHLDTLPIIDDSGNLKYIVTRSDIDKLAKYPNSTKDKNNRLQVLFASSTWPEDYERLERGFAAGADGVIIDTSQGFNQHEREMIRHIKNKYSEKLLIGGNISTKEAVIFLAEEGVDAYRCGQGVGSICTTAGAIGVSRAAATGVYECANAAKNRIKTIADGSLKEPGDIFKALAIGADCVMLGNLLAATEESPGEIIPDPETGLPVKIYIGMGAEEANIEKRRGYTKYPEGVPKQIRYRGSLYDWIPKIKSGILHAFEIHNFRTIADAQNAVYSENLRFERNLEEYSKESGAV